MGHHDFRSKHYSIHTNDRHRGQMRRSQCEVAFLPAHKSSSKKGELGLRPSALGQQLEADVNSDDPLDESSERGGILLHLP